MVPENNRKSKFVPHPQIAIETIVELHSPLVPRTGLKNVPEHIFENVSDEIKQAILTQQRIEREAE